MTNHARFPTKLALAVAISLAVVVLSYSLKRSSDGPALLVYTSVDQIFSEPRTTRLPRRGAWGSGRKPIL